MGSLRSQGLEGTSVSIGCFGREWGKGQKMGQYGVFWEATEGSDQNMHLSLALLPLSVGLRCGIIVVAGIRRNFCQYRV